MLRPPLFMLRLKTKGTAAIPTDPTHARMHSCPFHYRNHSEMPITLKTHTVSQPLPLFLSHILHLAGCGQVRSQPQPMPTAKLPRRSGLIGHGAIGSELVGYLASHLYEGA